MFTESADTISEERTKKKGKKIPAMMEDTFIATAGEIYSLAKEKYQERALLFAQWMNVNCIYDGEKWCLKHLHKNILKNWHSTEWWYKYWKDNINGKTDTPSKRVVPEVSEQERFQNK
jgi:DNA phosphorothioation-dependent restriction protein DptG